jgi:branched-subunit amino acid ABC-type transport system permease component
MIALGENPDLFRSLGFSVVRTQLVALALVSATLSLSALSVVELTGAYPTAGFPLVILGLLTRLIGGPAHRVAFYLAAVGVTVFDQAAAIILPGEWRTVALFGALLLLIARRSGREERR